MSLKKKIFNCLPDLSDVEIINAHREVIESIIKLNELIPKEYVDYNLTNIIMPKAYGYHTGFDTFYKRYMRIFKSLKKVVFKKSIAERISYKIIKKNSLSYLDNYKNNKDEMKVDYNSHGSLKEYNNKNCHNLLFANAQSYLRVLVMYINKSQCDNLLIIPKYLKNVDIIKKLSANSLFYYEDFITNEIMLQYEESKKIFSELFKYNNAKIQEYFTLSSRSFYPIINLGLENIFKYLLPQAVLFYLINQKIINEIKPNNIIGVRVRKIFDRAFYECSKNHGIDRYVMLHSNIGTDVDFIHTMGNFDDITGVFTWGEQQKEIIENDIFSNVKSVHVTGSPLFEKNEYNLENNKDKKSIKTILYAATNNDYYEISEIIKVVNKYKNKLKLIIKVHPSEESDPYKNFIDQKNIFLVTGDKVLEDLLPDSVLLITTISESALQGMLYKIPTMILLINKKWKDLLVSLYGFDKNEDKTMVVHNKKEINARINNLIFNKKDSALHLKKQKEILSKRIFFPEKTSSVYEIDKILIKRK